MNKQQFEEFQVLLRAEFMPFAQKCFMHLNPGVEFISGWHIELVSEWMSCCREPGQRMIVNLPPRHLKSLLGSIALPAWLLGRNPSTQILCASYGADLAEKLSRDCRSVMVSSWYRSLFPGTKLIRLAANELATSRGGVRLATSVDGAVTGRGADLIIIDDPLKPDEALSETTRKRVNLWFDNTLYTRLNDKMKGSILLIMQRLHEDDLTGHLESRDWSHLVLPAIAEEAVDQDIETNFGTIKVRRHIGEALHPERESLETLEDIKRNVGEYNFASQYQQSPAPAGGGMVRREWFRRYKQCDLPSQFDFILQSWDTANKPTELADFSVCTTWGKLGKNIYLIHVLRKKLDYPSLKRAICAQANAHHPTTILIEDKASGTQLLQELVDIGMANVTAYKPDAGSNKLMRMHAQTGLIENGFVSLPEKVDWLDAYLHELTMFPAGKNDDQVDSTSQALHWLSTKTLQPGILQYYEDLVKQANGLV